MSKNHLTSHEQEIADEMNRLSHQLEAKGDFRSMKWPNMVMSLVLKINELRGMIDEMQNDSFGDTDTESAELMDDEVIRMVS